MREDGIIVGEPNASGGSIQPASGGPLVRYSGHAVVGKPTPRKSEPVCFKRVFKGAMTASEVRFGACGALPRSGDGGDGDEDAASLQRHLEAAFRASFEAIPDMALSADARAEVARMSAERARRILRPLPNGEPLPDGVKSARFQLAEAAMSLMATEAATASDKTVTAEALCRALRDQRPPLPRKAKS